MNNLAPDENILITSCLLSVLLPPRKNESVHSSFTNSVATPVFIGGARGKGCPQNLHPTFTSNIDYP